MSRFVSWKKVIEEGVRDACSATRLSRQDQRKPFRIRKPTVRTSCQEVDPRPDRRRNVQKSLWESTWGFTCRAKGSTWHILETSSWLRDWNGVAMVTCATNVKGDGKNVEEQRWERGVRAFLVSYDCSTSHTKGAINVKFVLHIFTEREA